MADRELRCSRFSQASGATQGNIQQVGCGSKKAHVHCVPLLTLCPRSGGAVRLAVGAQMLLSDHVVGCELRGIFSPTAWTPSQCLLPLFRQSHNCTWCRSCSSFCHVRLSSRLLASCLHSVTEAHGTHWEAQGCHCPSHVDFFPCDILRALILYFYLLTGNMSTREGFLI